MGTQPDTGRKRNQCHNLHDVLDSPLTRVLLMCFSEAKADSVGVISITLVALSNTYGLMAIAFLLGFGLMEMPKFMWKVPTHA